MYIVSPGPPVAVKHQLPGLVSVPICLTKGRGDQVSAILWRYPMGHHFTREKVEGHTDIEILAIDVKTSDVADPNAVRVIHSKLPL